MRSPVRGKSDIRNQFISAFSAARIAARVTDFGTSVHAYVALHNAIATSHETFGIRTIAGTIHSTRAETTARRPRQAIPFLHDPKANNGLAATRKPMTNGVRNKRRCSNGIRGQARDAGRLDLRAARAP